MVAPSEGSKYQFSDQIWPVVSRDGTSSEGSKIQFADQIWLVVQHDCTCTIPYKKTIHLISLDWLLISYVSSINLRGIFL